MGRMKVRPRYKGLAAILSALAEGQMSRAEVDTVLAAVRMGVGLSKRDKALGQALEETGEDKDSPKYWDGFRDGIVQGYEGARHDLAAGVELRPIADLIAEAQAEAAKEGAAN